MPRISVLMSVYNDAKYVNEGLESILSQTLSEFEVIIVDDGSTDGTDDVLKEVKDPRVTLIRREHSGLAASLNYGLGIAQGEFIARQDADDVSCPSRFSLEVRALEGNPSLGVVGTGVTLVDEAGLELGHRVYPASHAQIREWLLNGRNPLVHSSLMFRRSAMNAMGGYDAHFVKSEDYDLHLRLSACWSIATIPEPLLRLRYRLDSLQASGGGFSEGMKYSLFARFLEECRCQGIVPSEGLWPEFFPIYEKWYKTQKDLTKSANSTAALRRARIWLECHDYVRCFEEILKIGCADPLTLMRKTFRQDSSGWGKARLAELLALYVQWETGTGGHG
ncbi:MAG: glycosyltransferase [Terracidiphilus sp.]